MEGLQHWKKLTHSLPLFILFIIVILLECCDNDQNDFEWNNKVEKWNSESLQEITQNCAYPTSLSWELKKFQNFIILNEVRKKLFSYPQVVEILNTNGKKVLIEKYSEGYFNYRATLCDYEEKMCYNFKFINSEIKPFVSKFEEDLELWSEELKIIIERGEFRCKIEVSEGEIIKGATP